MGRKGRQDEGMGRREIKVPIGGVYSPEYFLTQRVCSSQEVPTDWGGGLPQCCP